MFIEVELKENGGDYALDLTGAQLGYYDPVRPKLVYEQQMIEGRDTTQDFGNTRDRFKKELGAPIENTSYPLKMAYGFHAKLAVDWLLSTMKDWMRNEGTSAEDLLNFPIQRFEEQKQRFLVQAEDLLGSYVAALQF